MGFCNAASVGAGSSSSAYECASLLSVDKKCITSVLGILFLLGSVVTAGCLYGQIGSWSWVLGGGGGILGLGLFLSSQCICNHEWWGTAAKECLIDDQLHLYTTWLATQYPQIAVTELSMSLHNREGEDCSEGLLLYLSEINEKYGKEVNIPLYFSVNCTHWVLIYLDRKNRRVDYYDTLAIKSKSSTRRMEKIAEFLSAQEPDKPAYKYRRRINKPLQSDDYQCGPWVLWFVKNRLEHPEFDLNNLNKDEAQVMIANFRTEVTDKLSELKQAKKAAYRKAEEAYRQKHGGTEFEARVKVREATKNISYIERWKQILAGELNIKAEVFAADVL